MPMSCSVKGCNSRYKAQSGIHFFRFPSKDKQRLQLWTSAVGRKKWTPTATSKICSLHFSKSDFMIDLGYKNHQLRPDAVPSEFLIYGSVVRTMITDNNKKNIQMQSPNTTKLIEPEETLQIKPFIQQCINYKSKDDCILQTQKTMSNICETVEQSGDQESALIYLLKTKQNKAEQIENNLIDLPILSNGVKVYDNLTHKETLDNWTQENARADVNEIVLSKQYANEFKSACTSKKQKSLINAEQNFHVYQVESTLDESSAEDSVETCEEYVKTKKIELLAKKVIKLSRQVKTLKQKIRRRDQKINDMITLFKTVKKKI